MPPALPDGPAPSASLDHLEAQAAPAHPRAPAEHLGSSAWLQELASGRPKVEDAPLSTAPQARLFLSGLAWLDSSVGGVLAALEARQLVENGLYPV